jgi:uncharacterized membrane protein YbhN (UPF0104 family)
MSGLSSRALPKIPKPPKAVVNLLKLVVTAVAVWLVWNKVDFKGLGPPLRAADLGWLGLFIVLQFVIVYLNAARWRCLVAHPGTPLRKYLYYVFVGTFLALILPSAALAEGARTYAFGKRYGGVQTNFAAILFARLSGFVIQLAFMAGALFFAWPAVAGLPLWESLAFDLRPALLAVLAVAMGGVFIWIFLRDRALSFGRAFGEYLRGGVAARLRLLRVTVYSLVIQLLAMISTWALFRSVGADLEFWHIAVIPTLVQVILLLPVSFGGVGVREYLNVFLFTRLAGVSAETTLVASLLAYTSWLALAATGGAWFLFRRTRKNEED